MVTAPSMTDGVELLAFMPPAYRGDTPRVGSVEGKPICRSTALTTAGVRLLLAAGANRPARAAAIAALRLATWAGVVAGMVHGERRHHRTVIGANHPDRRSGRCMGHSRRRGMRRIQ